MSVCRYCVNANVCKYTVASDDCEDFEGVLEHYQKMMDDIEREEYYKAESEVKE